MNEKAYKEYVAKCKKKKVKPSSMEDLDRDFFISQSEHEYEPIHIIKPHDFTGKVKTITEQINALPDDKKFLMTKKQLLELKDLIEKG